MRAWLVGALLSTTAWASETTGIRLTSGWLTVLDVKDVLSVTSADPTIVSVAAVSDDQVLLLGVLPGETRVSVRAGRGPSPDQTDYPVTVSGEPTIQPFDDTLKVAVEHPSTLRAPSLRRVVVGDASICDAVAAGPDELELKPRRAGTTSVLVWTGGEGVAHRRQLLVTVESGGVTRTLDEIDSVSTEPFDGRLVLIAGEQAIIDLPALTRFAVNDSTVARARSGRRGELVVEGQSPGATRILVWTGRTRPESRFVVVLPRIRCEQPAFPPDEPAPEPLPVAKDL